jgi:proteasome accessory factor C
MAPSTKAGREFKVDRFRRINEILHVLEERKLPAGSRYLQERLECKRHTLYRTIDLAKSVLDAPIKYDARKRGWYLDRSAGAYSLPSVWFQPREILVLLALMKNIERLQTGLLREELKPLLTRLDRMLQNEQMGTARLLRRLRIIPMDDRPTPLEAFRACAEALTRSRRIRMRYRDRSRDAVTARTVSPQQLVHYRDNWYLDAWCHQAKALRTFSLDRMNNLHVQPEAAKSIARKTLQAYYAQSYGIFSGPPKHTAVLRFTPDRARWVSDERWHPQQEGRFLKNGVYELKIPYGDPRELILDILRHGPEVEVVSPESLRKTVKGRLKAALGQYSDDEKGV